MSKIFLGKPLHWFLLTVIVAALWYAGTLRLHVIHFNLFILALLAISTFCVLVVLYGSKDGERLTRDEIVPDETEERLDNL